MRRRAEIKPSRASSLLASAVGLGMIALGGAAFYGLYRAGEALAGLGIPISPIVSGCRAVGMWFVGVWLLAVGGITAQHLVNVFRKEGCALEVIEYDVPDEPGQIA